jgi:hypothetical protein
MRSRRSRSGSSNRLTAEPKPTAKRRRRTEAEIKRYTFREGFLTVVESVGDSAETISDEALEPLTTEQSAAAVETIETTRVKLGRLIDRLNREAASTATPKSTKGATDG